MDLEYFEAEITDEAKKSGLHRKVWQQLESIKRDVHHLGLEEEDGDSSSDPNNYHLVLQQTVNMKVEGDERRELLSLLLQYDEEFLKVPHEILDLVLSGEVELQRSELLDFDDPHRTVFRTFVDVRRKLLTMHPWDDSEQPFNAITLSDEDIGAIEKGRKCLRQKKFVERENIDC